MNWKRGSFLAALLAGVLSSGALAQDASRSGYSYVRDVSGDVTVVSSLNGRVEARKNLPIAAGDEILASDGARAEIGLADGNAMYVSAGTRARFSSIYGQQGEEDDFSAIDLQDGSLILAAVGADENAIPRIDTEDATTYLNRGARARVNYDPNRGTVVVTRAGTVEVRTRAGKFQVRAGEYLLARGDEDPELERGNFSRDRFDLWAAERLGSVYETRSASAQYVEDDYDDDVVALDGYGDWTYSDTYSTNVWRPRVSVGWSPYSNGSWYYTPAGLTWWSYDPWGWYPHHYGNWFFDASWNSWAWSPASVYSPAWVYWGYSGSYLGWCPVGYYSWYSPWYNNYYRHWGIPSRGGVYISIHGSFSTRSVDFRGWNFAGSSGVGVRRLDVIPGSRIAGRLGSTVAVSSRPIVVNARGRASGEAVRDYIREAPRVIERTATTGSSRLAPVLARERSLPADTVEAIRDRRIVVPQRGRLTGPGVADIAPRGAVVDRSRRIEPRGRDSAGAGEIDRSRRPIGRDSSGEPRAVTRERSGRDSEVDRGPSSDRGSRQGREVESRPSDRGDRAPVDRGRERQAAPPPSRERQAPPQRAPQPPDSSSWRSRSRSFEAVPGSPAREVAPSENGWRSRSVRPAQRVIEGAVPGRRAADAEARRYRAPEVRERDWTAQPRARDTRPDVATPPQWRREAPAPRYERREAPAPRYEHREAPAPRYERREAPAPRYERREAPAPRYERREAAPRPRVERAPAPPPPRASRSEARRQAPPPPPGRDRSRSRH